jgi:DNA repair protein RadC
MESKRAEEMGDAELLTAVLGTDQHTGLSLLEEIGGLARLSRMGVGELEARADVQRSSQILAAIELGRRCIQHTGNLTGIKLPHSEAVVSWATPRMATLDHEELWVLSLDGQSNLRSHIKVAQGGIHGMHVGVKDVLRAVLKEAASVFILVHNHPSGDPTPSEEDMTFTRAVMRGCKEIGVSMVDHVIIARQRHSSMLQKGILEDLYM